jgi:RNA recognition motif-containing protein
VIEFFGDIEVDEDNIHLEQRFGRKTGTGLVFLSSEDDVQKARDELNRQYIGSRYVDVLIPRIETGDE